MEEKTMKHYSGKHNILLVGEKDFSFSLCLAKALGSASNIVATSFNSKDVSTRIYSGALGNILQLENLGCTIMLEVDTRTLSKHPILQSLLFDRIVFDFDFLGSFIQQGHTSKVEPYKQILKEFMESSREMVSEEDGKIYVRLRTANPFCKQIIEETAEEVGLYKFNQVPFYLWDYEGGSGGRKCDDVSFISTFIFMKELPSCFFQKKMEKCLRILEL